MSNTVLKTFSKGMLCEGDGRVILDQMVNSYANQNDLTIKSVSIAIDASRVIYASVVFTETK